MPDVHERRENAVAQYVAGHITVTVLEASLFATGLRLHALRDAMQEAEHQKMREKIRS